MKRPQGISSKKLVDGSLSWRFRFKHGKKREGGDRLCQPSRFRDHARSGRRDATRESTPRKSAAACEVREIVWPIFLEWLEYAGAEWAPKTREVNRYHAERAIVRFGHVPLSKITIELLNQEQRYLLTYGKLTHRGRSPPLTQVGQETFTLVKAALRQAKKWSYVGADPGVDLDVPTIKRRPKAVLQEDQLERVLQSVLGTRICSRGVGRSERMSSRRNPRTTDWRRELRDRRNGGQR